MIHLNTFELHPLSGPNLSPLGHDSIFKENLISYSQNSHFDYHEINMDLIIKIISVSYEVTKPVNTSIILLCMSASYSALVILTKQQHSLHEIYKLIMLANLGID